MGLDQTGPIYGVLKARILNAIEAIKVYLKPVKPVVKKPVVKPVVKPVKVESKEVIKPVVKEITTEEKLNVGKILKQTVSIRNRSNFMKEYNGNYHKSINKL